MIKQKINQPTKNSKREDGRMTPVGVESVLTACLRWLAEGKEQQSARLLIAWALHALERKAICAQFAKKCEMMAARSSEGEEAQRAAFACEFAAFLVEAGADAHAMTTVERKLRPGDEHEKGWDENWTLLMIAVKHGSLGCVQALAKVCDLDALGTETGPSALTLAIFNGDGRGECVQTLVDAGCSVAPVVAGDNFPLSGAAMTGNKQSLLALLPHCDAKAKCKKGMTALMWAAKTGAIESIQILAPFSDAKAQDADSRNALMHACLHAQPPAVKLLLAVSDLYQKDAKGLTALDLAVSTAQGRSVRCEDGWGCVDQFANFTPIDQLKTIAKNSPKEKIPRILAAIEKAEMLEEMGSGSAALDLRAKPAEPDTQRNDALSPNKTANKSSTSEKKQKAVRRI